MNHFLSFFIFLFGLAIGSFINVIVYRINHDKNPLKGRSFCPKCKHKLAWKDNIPLLSFIFLKRKCRYCRSPISWQYPIVELTTAVLTLLIFNFQFSIFNLLITYALIALFVSDLLYQTLPDHISYPAVAMVFIYRLVNKNLSSLIPAFGASLFFLFLHLATRGKGMAIGDVKLVFLLGLFLGWPKILFCLYFAFLAGAIIGIILILVKKKQFGQVIAFGPFLIVGAFFAFIFDKMLINLYFRYLSLLF